MDFKLCLFIGFAASLTPFACRGRGDDPSLAGSVREGGVADPGDGAGGQRGAAASGGGAVSPPDAGGGAAVATSTSHGAAAGSDGSSSSTGSAGDAAPAPMVGDGGTTAGPGSPGRDAGSAVVSVDAASGGDAAGDGPGAMVDPFAADVTPTRTGDVWSLSYGQTVFAVDASRGASVTTYSLGGHNVLADGSHFRPSPQKTWTWPPPPEIAALAYTASASGNVLVMGSQTNAQWGLKAQKRFWASSKNDVVTIEYTLTNTGAARASWAPWEVSRVNATGLTFFPEGVPIAAKPASFGQLMALPSSGGAAWLDYQPAAFTAGNYIVARDGLEGWSAHAEAGVAFIKSFPDISAAQIPPEEGEIQLWTDNTHVALEMENEGAYVPLAAGQSIVWTLRWYLRAIPGDVPVEVGNTKLLAFVRAQLL